MSESLKESDGMKIDNTIKRRLRVRKEWLVKEEFSCVKCGAKDKDISWNDKNSDHPAGQPEEVLFCLKCGHKLTKKEELEEEIIFKEIQQYGFWLRGLMSEHFIPCEKCQDRLHEMMMTMTVAFYTQDCITIETLKKKDELVWQFRLRFLTCGGLSDKEVFKPCEKCQKKLRKLWEIKNLHIGSEIKPPVELWRKMNQIIPELDNIPVPASFEMNKSQILDVKEASKVGELPVPNRSNRNT